MMVLERLCRPWRLLPQPRWLLVAPALVIAVLASPAEASKRRPRAQTIELTPDSVKLFIACYPGVEQARKRAEAAHPGQSLTAYKNRQSLSQELWTKALERCRFPHELDWRSLEATVKRTHNSEKEGYELHPTNQALVKERWREVDRLLHSR